MMKIVSTAALLALLAAPAWGTDGNNANTITFEMTPSAGAKACLPNAHADVVVTTLDTVEVMTIRSSGLPPNTDFVIFILQVPNAPFGLSWYQGDIPTDVNGRGAQEFRGRFNFGTFIVAPGAAPAPNTHPGGPFPDALTNPATAPVELYHLGMWFADPNDAGKNGCPSTATPFDSDHVAGIQVLNTAGFPDNAGPLSQLGRP